MHQHRLNCHNDESLYLLHDMGVTRAVLAREMNIDEIKALRCPIEKKYLFMGLYA